MNRLFRAVALTAVLPVSIACAARDSKNAATSTSPTINPKPTASTPTSAAKSLTKRQLAAALLTRADLPPGFKKAKQGGGESGDDLKVKAPNRKCEKLLQQTGAKDEKVLDGSLAEAEVGYESGSSSISQVAASFPTDLAGQQVPLVHSALSSCKRLSMSGDGLTLQFKVDNLPLPQLADRSAAYRWNGTAPGVRFTMDMVTVQIKNTVTMVVRMDLGPGNTSQTEQITRKAADRLQAATPG